MYLEKKWAERSFTDSFVWSTMGLNGISPKQFLTDDVLEVAIAAYSEFESQPRCRPKLGAWRAAPRGERKARERKGWHVVATWRKSAP